MLHSVKRLTGLFALSLVLSPAFVFGQASFEAQVRGVVRDATGGVQAFNAFNRTLFDRAGVGWGGGSFGQANALAQGFRPRQLQIVARVEF